MSDIYFARIFFYQYFFFLHPRPRLVDRQPSLHFLELALITSESWRMFEQTVASAGVTYLTGWPLDTLLTSPIFIVSLFFFHNFFHIHSSVYQNVHNISSFVNLALIRSLEKSLIEGRFFLLL